MSPIQLSNMVTKRKTTKRKQLKLLNPKKLIMMSRTPDMSRMKVKCSRHADQLETEVPQDSGNQPGQANDMKRVKCRLMPGRLMSVLNTPTTYMHKRTQILSLITNMMTFKQWWLCQLLMRSMRRHSKEVFPLHNSTCYKKAWKFLVIKVALRLQKSLISSTSELALVLYQSQAWLPKRGRRPWKLFYSSLRSKTSPSRED